MDEKYIQMLIETNQSAKSAHKRIDTVEKAIGETRELTIAVKEIAMETKATREDVNDMNSRLKIVEEKPMKNWENLTKTIITRNCNSSSRIFFSKIRNVGKESEKYGNNSRNDISSSNWSNNIHIWTSFKEIQHSREQIYTSAKCSNRNSSRSNMLYAKS